MLAMPAIPTALSCCNLARCAVVRTVIFAGSAILLSQGPFGCARQNAPSPAACWDQTDCSEGERAMVCEQGACRQACHEGLWVGQTVQVTNPQGSRQAVISACPPIQESKTETVSQNAASEPASELPSGTSSAHAPATSAKASLGGKHAQAAPSTPAQLWVRYETGIEQQVLAAKVRPHRAR